MQEASYEKDLESFKNQLRHSAGNAEMKSLVEIFIEKVETFKEAGSNSKYGRTALSELYVRPMTVTEQFTPGGIMISFTGHDDTSTLQFNHEKMWVDMPEFKQKYSSDRYAERSSDRSDGDWVTEVVRNLRRMLELYNFEGRSMPPGSPWIPGENVPPWAVME